MKENSFKYLQKNSYLHENYYYKRKEKNNNNNNNFHLHIPININKNKKIFTLFSRKYGGGVYTINFDFELSNFYCTHNTKYQWELKCE